MGNPVSDYTRECVERGFACDLPQRYLPVDLKWTNWKKKHKVVNVIIKGQPVSYKYQDSSFLNGE